MNKNKTIPVFIVIVLTLITTSTIFAQKRDTLNNEKIIMLYKAGFSKEVLIPKIKSSVPQFDTSIQGLLSLKKGGLPDDLIEFILTQKIPIGQQRLDIGDANNFKNLKPGIYYTGKKGNLMEIEPSILTNSKSNGTATVFLGGLFNSKVKVSLSGDESYTTIKNNRPVFTFVFDQEENTSLNSGDNYWSSATRSPKEFLLVKLKVVKNSREIVTGKGNLLKQNNGIEDEYLIRFKYDKVSSNVYTVSIPQGLPQGEYCFMFAQGVRSGQTVRVFDFSVK